MDYKALQEAESLVSGDPDIPDHKKQEIAAKLQQARTPLETDRWIYRMVVGSLGLAVLGCIIFSFLLVWHHAAGQGQADLKIPEIFMAIGSAAVGALAGLLAPSPVNRGS